MSDDTQPTVPMPTEPYPSLPTEPLRSAPVQTAPDPSAPDPLPAPRIRWAGVVWGALFCAFGIAVLGALSTAQNQTAYASWIAGLGPWGAGVVVLVALGVLVLILGILGAVGRAQRRP